MKKLAKHLLVHLLLLGLITSVFAGGEQEKAAGKLVLHHHLLPGGLSGPADRVYELHQHVGRFVRQPER